MILTMVFFFFAAWFPYAMICLLRIFGIGYPDFYVAIAMMSAKSSAWTNTAIYIGMNYHVRKYVLPTHINYAIDDLLSKDVAAAGTNAQNTTAEEGKDVETIVTTQASVQSSKANQVAPTESKSRPASSTFTEEVHMEMRKNSRSSVAGLQITTRKSSF